MSDDATRQTQQVSKRVPKSDEGAVSPSPPPDEPSGGDDGSATGKALPSKTSKIKRVKTGAKGRTGKAPRPKKGGKKGPETEKSEKELEPITPFARGLSIGVKFAGLTACVVGLFMGLLGYLTYTITAREMDAQINEQGAALASSLEATIDRGMWISRDEKVPTGPKDPKDPKKPQTQIIVREKNRQELIDIWKHRFRDIVEPSDGKVQRILVVETEGGAPKNIVGGFPDDKQISLGSERELAKEGSVSVSELTLGGLRVRRFAKQITIDLGVDLELDKLMQEIPTLDPSSDDHQKKLERVRELSRDASIKSMEDFEHWREEHPLRYRLEESKGYTPELWVFVRAARLDEVKSELWRRIAVVTLCGAVAGILLTVLISAVLTGPIRELETDIAEVAGGNMEHQSRVRSADEIGALAHVFNIMARNLKTAQENAVERKAFERELNIAKEIQEKLLPERIPQIPGLDIHSHYNSAKEVGGDYYDFIVIDQTHLGIIVADVAGKGIPGAMVMTMARSLVRLASVRNVSPSDTFKKVNRILAKDIRRGMFVTSAYMVLNVKTRTLKVASAGHNPVVLYRAKSGDNELIKPKGIALGFDKGTIFDNNIQELEVQLEPGDRIVTYTDGVNEAMNNDSEEFGDDRFYQLVKQHAGKSSKEFVDAVVVALDRHRGDAEQSDDITIVTLSLDGAAKS
ncbi:MAG: PP2C family protein-serine/threonine phosphatase [Planctomycetota bacterium]